MYDCNHITATCIYILTIVGVSAVVYDFVWNKIMPLAVFVIENLCLLYALMYVCKTDNQPWHLSFHFSV